MSNFLHYIIKRGTLSQNVYTTILKKKSDLHFTYLNRTCIEYSQDSVVGTHANLWAGKLKNSSSSIRRGQSFLYYMSPRSAAGPRRTPVHRVSTVGKPDVM